MKSSFTSIVAVLVAVTLLGSIIATTTLLQQQASAIIIEGGKDFKKLSKQFQRDALNIGAQNPPEPEKLAALFDAYEQATFRIFGLTPR